MYANKILEHKSHPSEDINKFHQYLQISTQVKKLDIFKLFSP